MELELHFKKRDRNEYRHKVLATLPMVSKDGWRHDFEIQEHGYIRILTSGVENKMQRFKVRESMIPYIYKVLSDKQDCCFNISGITRDRFYITNTKEGLHIVLKLGATNTFDKYF